MDHYEHLKTTSTANVLIKFCQKFLFFFFTNAKKILLYENLGEERLLGIINNSLFKDTNDFLKSISKMTKKDLKISEIKNQINWEYLLRSIVILE